MKLKQILFIAFCISLVTTAVQASLQQYQSHDEIVAEAMAYLQETNSSLAGHTEIEVSPLDHRLRLIACDDPLETFSPTQAKTIGKTTVGVRCDSPKPWTLYVSATVKIHGPVVLANRDLARGSVLTSGDLQLTEQDTSHLLRGYFDELTLVTGRTLKRSLRRGQVITPSMLQVQKTIKRGEQVTIVAGKGGIEVRMKGKALKYGNPGDVIPIQNLASKKKLEARVISAGLVRVD